jgi:hypothetical protein
VTQLSRYEQVIEAQKVPELEVEEDLELEVKEELERE